MHKSLINYIIYYLLIKEVILINSINLIIKEIFASKLLFKGNLKLFFIIKNLKLFKYIKIII